MLIPDFCGNVDALNNVLAARPNVLNHNTETVPRLYKRVRPDAAYSVDGAAAKGARSQRRVAAVDQVRVNGRIGRNRRPVARRL